PPSPLHARPAASRSLPTRSGIRESSPDNHSAPKTRSSHPPTTVPHPQSGTAAPPTLFPTHPLQTSPPSAPAASDTLLLLPLRRCTVLPAPPAALVAGRHPECR